MGARGKAVQGHRRLRRQAACAALVLCGSLALTACNGDDGSVGAAGATPGASTAPPSAAATSSAAPGGSTPSASATASKKPTPAATATGKPKPPAPAPAPTCDHKMPISPDEIAVYRYTPEGGTLSLIVKHGNWGCPVPGGSTPFVTVGEETFIPVADDAKITAMAPILSGSVSKPITAHELTSWLESHPNKGLVFHYNVNHRGMIETLGQEEYTP
ncbi:MULTISPECIES: hypothetical protein [unclassified Streptomyces]|uniref:hypothetical protein n=1 Tax=unclassified Streptomyces TaxID=2593676 RepID=UPI000A461A9C|nr:MULTISPECIES: hypothetical protein [unclassified Streptomyces]MCX5148356.1 hypothetical protein [Streptomyces sp. NBC_00320]WSN51448.1 hypothetical protein OG299_29060 [Streptomyces sp. NBC_01296]WSW59128.1 hypothetical protein OG513_11385 [Streptomyces sp. NBC_00998]